MSSDINVQTFSGKVNITSNLLVGSSHLFVDTINNRVGLVTVNPQAGLHVNSNAYVDTDFRVGPSIVMNETSGLITAGSFVGDGSGITSVNSDSGSWVNGTSSNVHLATTGDSVGIGTVSPEAQLHIGPKDNDHIYLASSNNDYGWKIDTDDQGAGDVPFRIIKRTDDVDTTILTIKNQDGNVGIGGAASVTNKLKVTGTIEATTGFSGTATNATNVTLAASSTAANHSVIFSSGTTGSQALKTDPGLLYNPSTNILTTNVSGNATSVTVAASSTAANHSVIFSSGTTGSQALKTDPGLVYNPSTNILTTNVSGNATSVTVAASSTAANHSVIFSSGTTGSQALKTDPGLVYNPSTNILTTNVSGNATSVTVAASSTAANHSVTFSSGATGSQALKTDPGLLYNPSTNILTTNVSGSATSAGNADTVDSLHASSFLRSDADDTVGAGVTYTWSATDTQGLVFKNSSYNTFLYLGGWAHTNSNDISRIRTSSGNLHIDSAANGNCYLNWYSGGSIELGRNTTVRGHVDASTEVYVQNWVRTRGNTGHYWEGTSNGSGWHIYPKDRADMYMRTGSGNGGLAFCIADNNVRGYIHCTTSNEIGFLNSGRSWSLRMDNSYNCQVYGRMYASGYVNSIMTARYYNVNGSNGNYTATRPISVYAAHQMRCTELQVESDRRIKTDIVDVDDISALTLLRKIKPRTYGYVDKVHNGEGHVYGFIAQEIKELIPDAVDVSEGDLPNIYKHATIDIQANSITIKDFDTSTLNQTDSIIYIDQDDQRQTLKIKSIINSTQLEIEEDLEKVVETLKTSKMKEYNFTGEIFIWGQRVQDFHHLKKSAIYTVTTAALQEVDRQLQAEKIKTYELRQKVELLEMSHGALIQRVEALEKL